jgi:hypothetical protein
VQQEEGQTSLLLQSIHTMIDNHAQATDPAQPKNKPTIPSHAHDGATLQRYLGVGIGWAIMSGAGFGIGSDLINKML